METAQGLQVLADWIDLKYPDDSSPEVQVDLRRWVDDFEQVQARAKRLEDGLLKLRHYTRYGSAGRQILEAALAEGDGDANPGLLHSPETIEATKRGIEDWREGRVKPLKPTQTDTATKLVTLRAALAAATEECLGGGYKSCTIPECRQGYVPRFPGFRQMCPCVAIGEQEECEGCNGSGWQVRAGGMADVLARLERREALIVLRKFDEWLWPYNRHGMRPDDPAGPIPDRDTILVKALELVCEVKGLGVADG